MWQWLIDVEANSHHNIYHRLPAASFIDEMFYKRAHIVDINSTQWGEED